MIRKLSKRYHRYRICRSYISSLRNKEAQNHVLRDMERYIEEQKRAEFFLGRYSKSLVLKSLTKLFARIKVGNSYELGFLKLPEIKSKYALCLELPDLVFPYIFEDWPEEMSGEGTYEQFGLVVSAGDVVMDIGANMGLFSVFATKIRKASKVYAFEPVAEVCKMLEHIIKINEEVSKISTVNFALSNFDGTGIMCADDSNIGGGYLMVAENATKPQGEVVSIVKLDTFVHENQIDRVDFIKADIEGAERYMLEGAKEVLKKFKPKLAICTYHLPDDPDVLTRIILEANPDYKIYYSSHKLFAL